MITPKPGMTDTNTADRVLNVTTAVGSGVIGPGALFRAGRLADAVTAAEQRLRAKPGDASERVLLAELLLFAGQFERADTILVAAEVVEPAMAMVIAEFRQLLRAAVARQQLVNEGRVPNFLGEPTPAQTCLLRALVAVRALDVSAANAAVEEAEACRPEVSGSANGTAFAGFRDADDLFGGTIEVLTTTGKYYWIPVERITSMEFHVPKRARDLFWRRCTLTVHAGPDGEVYIPTLYEIGTDHRKVTEDSLRLGRSTEWSETTPVRGIGQRVFLIGEGGVPINELQTVYFT